MGYTQNDKAWVRDHHATVHGIDFHSEYLGW